MVGLFHFMAWVVNFGNVQDVLGNVTTSGLNFINEEAAHFVLASVFFFFFFIEVAQIFTRKMRSFWEKKFIESHMSHT